MLLGICNQVNLEKHEFRSLSAKETFNALVGRYCFQYSRQAME